MYQKHLQLLGLLIVILGNTSNAPAASSEAETIVREAWARYRSVKTEVDNVHFLTIPALIDERILSMEDARKIFAKPPAGAVHKIAKRSTRFEDHGNDRILIHFSEPASDQGTTFLVWRQPDAKQDDQWVYVPGMPRPRRVSASSTQSFMGTNFIHEDIREFAGERVGRYEYSFDGEGDLNDRKCTWVVSKPRRETITAYRRRRTCFDAKTLLPLVTEYYGPSGGLAKVLRTSDIEAIAENSHRANVAELRDLAAGEVTVMLLSDRKVAIPIPDEIFTQDRMMDPDLE